MTASARHQPISSTVVAVILMMAITILGAQTWISVPVAVFLLTVVVWFEGSGQHRERALLLAMLAAAATNGIRNVRVSGTADHRGIELACLLVFVIAATFGSRAGRRSRGRRRRRRRRLMSNSLPSGSRIAPAL
jgi:hypothetical protein